MVILEIFEGKLVPISFDLDHLKSLKRTNFLPPLNSYQQKTFGNLLEMGNSKLLMTKVRQKSFDSLYDHLSRFV